MAPVGWDYHANDRAPAGEGLSNREIGQKLFVSPRTVSTHLYRIYPKLGVSGRGQLASALSETT
jgi:DNA-binding CsgD family transcriptional regulator